MVANDSLYGVFTFRGKCVIVEVVVVKESFGSSEVCHFPCYNSCSISDTLRLESPFDEALDVNL
jgi:hypothetical protein